MAVIDIPVGNFSERLKYLAEGPKICKFEKAVVDIRVFECYPLNMAREPYKSPIDTLWLIRTLTSKAVAGAFGFIVEKYNA